MSRKYILEERIVLRRTVLSKIFRREKIVQRKFLFGEVICPGRKYLKFELQIENRPEGKEMVFVRIVYEKRLSRGNLSSE